MKKVTKAVAALMLMTAVLYPAECMHAQTYKGHDYVDLGLPSGTLWATCNVGANSPEDYGNLYAWGETTTKTTYDWSTYKYCNGNLKTLTKYCNCSALGNNGFTDTLTVLQSSDDAATANWGSGWCMPTKAQWEELMHNTTVTCTMQNGVSGSRFTASNGNSLFLPAAGYHDRDWSSLWNFGFYWSSSLEMFYPEHPYKAWHFYINLNDHYMYTHKRCDGYSVRPVRSAK